MCHLQLHRKSCWQNWSVFLGAVGIELNNASAWMLLSLHWWKAAQKYKDEEDCTSVLIQCSESSSLLSSCQVWKLASVFWSSSGSRNKAVVEQLWSGKRGVLGQLWSIFLGSNTTVDWNVLRLVNTKIQYWWTDKTYHKYVYMFPSLKHNSWQSNNSEKTRSAMFWISLGLELRRMKNVHVNKTPQLTRTAED